MRDYAWQRFWYPAGGDVYLEPEGFLTDPESSLGRHFNEEAKRLEEIDEVPCLALLGEPGMGKTRTLRAARDRLATAGKRTQLVSLGHFSSETRLISKIFAHRDFRSWQRGGGRRRCSRPDRRHGGSASFALSATR